MALTAERRFPPRTISCRCMPSPSRWRCPAASAASPDEAMIVNTLLVGLTATRHMTQDHACRGMPAIVAEAASATAALRITITCEAARAAGSTWFCGCWLSDCVELPCCSSTCPARLVDRCLKEVAGRADDDAERHRPADHLPASPTKESEYLLRLHGSAVPVCAGRAHSATWRRDAKSIEGAAAQPGDRSCRPRSARRRAAVLVLRDCPRRCRLAVPAGGPLGSGWRPARPVASSS